MKRKIKRIKKRPHVSTGEQGAKKQLENMLLPRGKVIDINEAKTGKK